MDEQTLARVVGAAVAEAIKATQPAGVDTPGTMVTIGATSNPKVDEQLYCLGCRTGNPPWMSTEAQREKAAELLAEMKPDEAAKLIGPLPGVPRTISYDESKALATIEAGKVGKQCRNCGNAK